MSEIKMSEDELVNALCVYIAQKRQVAPEDVLVELVHDDYGFSAEVEVNNRQQILIEANLIEAVRDWLRAEYDMNPFSARLRLELNEEEGIIVFATV